MYRIFLLAVILSLISVFLKNNIKEYDLIFKLCGGALIILFLINDASAYLKDFFNDIDIFTEERPIINTLIKGAVISITTKLCGDVCRESGNIFLEDIVEFGGRIMLFIITVPYITKIFEIAMSFID